MVKWCSSPDCETARNQKGCILLSSDSLTDFLSHVRLSGFPLWVLLRQTRPCHTTPAVAPPFGTIDVPVAPVSNNPLSKSTLAVALHHACTDAYQRSTSCMPPCTGYVTRSLASAAHPACLACILSFSTPHSHAHSHAWEHLRRRPSRHHLAASAARDPTLCCAVHPMCRRITTHAHALSSACTRGLLHATWRSQWLKRR